MWQAGGDEERAVSALETELSKEVRGATGLRGQFGKGEFQFRSSVTGHPPKRQSVGPFTRPSLENVAGEIKMGRNFRKHNATLAPAVPRANADNGARTDGAT